ISVGGIEVFSSSADIQLVGEFNIGVQEMLPRSDSNAVLNVRRSAVLALTAIILLGSAILSARAASVRVPTDKLMSAAKKKPSPEFPSIAKTVNAQGQVEVEIRVGEDGKVKEARPISGHPVLREPARAAAEKWEFDPTKLSDSPSEVVGILVF